MQTDMNALIIADIKRIADVFGPDQMDRLQSEFTLIAPPISTDAVSEFAESVKSVELIFSTWGAPVMDATFLERCPQLKAVFYAAGTVKYFLSDAFWQRKIRLSNAAEANAVPVAEYTFAQIILGLKRAFHWQRELKAQKSYPELDRLMELKGTFGSRVGLVSMGLIGQKVLERLRSLDVQISVCDPFIKQDWADAQKVTLCDLNTLFETCDVISLHTPWLKETERMIGREQLMRMPLNGTFINTSRGAIVNESEFFESLMARPDLQAVIDVTWPEPPIENSPFYTLPNVFLCPHIAGSLGWECRRMGAWMIDEAIRFKQNKPLYHEITLERLKSMA
jgi:phosphoglycerate dehydrogenase-like enzyme